MLCDMSDVTHILSQIEAGDPQAAEKLLPLVYDELRKLAAVKLAREKPGQTLQATALVHEAYLRLIGPANQNGFDHRGHFFAAAASAMRRILVEAARRKDRERHGGNHVRIELSHLESLVDEGHKDGRLVALDESLSHLAEEDSSAAQVVELHHFAGLSHEQVAAVMKVTVYEARQKWTYARAWLQAALSEN
jgi:RNA polymerase sigma factor (TIGR02999 family)